MKTYTIELKKVIVVHVQAETQKDALKQCEQKNAFDDSWYYAEPDAKVIDIEEEVKP